MQLININLLSKGIDLKNKTKQQRNISVYFGRRQSRTNTAETFGNIFAMLTLGVTIFVGPLIIAQLLRIIQHNQPHDAKIYGHQSFYIGSADYGLASSAGD